MIRTPGVSGRRRWVGWARPASVPGVGLTGVRYLLAVAVLTALTSVPMLVAVVAGVATLTEPPPVAADATPFVIYRSAPPPLAPPVAAELSCPAWPNWPS